MTWLRRVCSVVALAVLSGVSTHGNAFVITANPASITAGNSALVTLEGVLSATALLVVTIAYDPALLSPDLSDPFAALDDGVTGKPDAFAFYDNQGPGSFDYVVVAATELSVSGGPILSIPFTTLAAGPALLTFTTCAATAEQNCIPGDLDAAEPSTAEPSGSQNQPLFTIQPAANQVPEPSSILLVLSTLILSSVFLRRRKARV